MFHKEARERYQNLSEGEKGKRWKKVQDRHKNLSEEENKRKLSIWEIIIYHITNNFLEFYKVVGKFRIPRTNFRISKTYLNI